jgi:autotransporter-associated beta strand protein
MIEVAAANALGSGATAGVTLEGGTLRVDYALGGTLATQAFSFGGGTLLLIGNTDAVTQGIGAVTLANGSSTLSAIPGAGGSTTVNLGSINRSGSATRALLNLNGPATWTTTQANDATGKLAGVLFGGALAANDGAGGIIKFAGTQLASNFIESSTADLVIGANVTGDLSLTNSGTTTVGSLSLDGTAAGRTIDIGTGNTLRVTGGLFQVSSGLAFNLAGGTLTGGAADNTAADLLINATGGMATGAGMTVSSVIADNGTGAVTLVKGGVGALSLTGANTFSGGLLIQQGRVIVGSDAAAGAGAITINDGGQLYATGNLSRAITLNGGIGPAEGAGNLGAIRIEGGVTLSGAITVARDSQVTTHSGATGTLSGAVTLNAALVKTGSGTLNLTGGGSNSGAGTLFVKEGIAQVGLANTYNTVSYDAYVASGARLVALGYNSWVGNLVTVAAGGVFEVSGTDTSGAHNKFRNINLLGGSWIGTGGGKYAGEDGNFAGTEFSVFVGGSSRSLFETPNRVNLNETRFYVQDVTGNSAPDFLVKGAFNGNSGYLGGLGTTRFERRVGSSANSNHTANMVVQAGHTLEYAGDGAMGTGTITLDGGRLRATSLDGLAEYQISGTSAMNTSSAGTFRQVTVDATRANSTVDFGGDTTWSYRGRIVVDATRTLAFRESIDDAAWVRVWGTATDGTVVDQVVLNDGNWDATTTGTITLGAGTYNLDVRAQNGGGGAGGFIQWDPNGGTNWSAVGIPTVSGVRLVSELGLSQTVSNSVALNRRSEVEVLESADTLTLSGVVSGAGMLEKTGAGVLVLSNTNTFTGGLTVAGGTLRFATAGNLGAGGINLLEGSTLAYSGSAALTISNPVSVELGNAILAVASESGALTLGQGVDNYLDGAVTRDVTKTGLGTLVVAGPSTGNNRFVVEAGTVSVTSTDATRASANVGASGTLSVASSTFGSITNAGTTTAASTTLGALTTTAGTLTAANATTVGALAVSGGTVTAGSATNSGNISVTGGSLLATSLANAGTLGVSAGSATLGAVSAGATTLSGGILQFGSGATLASLDKTGGSLLIAGNGTAGTLNITGDASLDGVLRFDLSSSTASGNDLILVGGDVSLLGLTEVNLGLLSGSLATGEYILVTGASIEEPLASLGLVSITGVASGDSRQTLTLSASETVNALSLIVDGSVANLSFANGGTATGVWSSSSDDTVWSNGGTADHFYSGDVVSFGDLAGIAAQTVTLAGELSPGAVTFANTAATTYTLAGDGALVGVAGLTVSGGGRVILANTGTNTYSGATTLTSGTLELGAAGVLSANSATVVNGGTLDIADINDAVAGAVTLSSGSIVGTTGSLSASSISVTGGLLDANLAGTGSLTFNGAGATFAYAKSAAHTGGTTLAAGTLNLSGSLSGSLAQSASTTLNLSGSVGGALTLEVGATADISATGAANGGVTLTGSLSGGSTLTSAGAIAGGATIGRNSTLTSSGSIAGGATISVGGLLVTSGQLAGNVANAGTLRFAGAGEVAYAGVISGGSLVEKTGVGTVTLSGTTHGIGTLALQEGRLVVNTGSGGTSNNTLNSANLTQANGTTLAFGSSTSLNGNLSFAGDSAIEVASGVTVWKETAGVLGTNSAGATLRKTGAGRLVISTNNMGFGAGSQVIVDEGTLQLNKGNWFQGSVLGQATLTVNSGGTVDITSYHVFDAFSTFVPVVNGGTITGNGQDVYVGGFVMTGGTVTGTRFVNLTNITTNASAATATSSANLSTGAATLSVADGAAAVDFLLAPYWNGTTNTTSLTKTGAGLMQVTLSATGTLALNEGSVQVGAGGTAGTVGNVTSAAGTSLSFNRSDDYAHTATIAGAVAVSHIGSGKLTLSGGNSFTGGITLAGGTLALGADNAAGTGGLTVATASANLEIANGLAVSRTTLSGTGDLTKSGAGTLTLTGASSLAGNLSVTEGSLNLSGADSLGHSGTVSVAAGSSLLVGASVVDLGTAAITNAGTLAISGSTARSLSNSGTVTVASGGSLGDVTLASGSVTSAGTLGAVNLSAAGTLSSTGTVGNVTATGGALSLSGTAGALSLSSETVFNVGGLNATGALAVSSLTVLDGVRLEFEISDPSTSAFQDRIDLSGGVLDLSGVTTPIALDVYGFSRGTGTRGSATVFNRYADYTINLISGASEVQGDLDDFAFTIDGFGDGLDAAGTWSLVQVADGINLVYEGIALPESLITVGTGLTQGLADSQAGLDFLAADDEQILVKSGAGRLTVAEALTHVGGTKVNEGILLLSGSQAALGSGDVTLALGTSLEINLEGDVSSNVSGQGVIRKVGTDSATLSGILANTGGIFVDAGILGTNFAPYASTVTVADAAIANFLGDATQTFSGNLAGAGSVTILEGRVVTLAASNTGFTGTFDVQDGGVVLAANQAAGSGTVQLAEGSTATVSGAVTLGSLITGAGSLDKTGAGLSTLTVDPTLTGSIAVNQGTLRGDFSQASGAIAVAAGATLDFAVATTATRGAADITGAGAFAKTGAGTLTLTSASGVTGGIRVEEGVLSSADFGTASSVAVSAGATAEVNLASDATLATVFTGDGIFRKAGTSSLTLGATGLSTFSGKVRLVAGNLNIGTTSSFGLVTGSDAIQIAGGNLVFSQGMTFGLGVQVSSLGGRLDASALGQTGTVTLNSEVSGTGELILAGSGNTSAGGGGDGGLGIRLTNDANSFTGDIRITSGLVSYASSAALGNAANRIVFDGGGILDNSVNLSLARDMHVTANGGLIRLYGSASATYSGALTGSGELRRTDSGTTVFSGDLSGFTGTLTNQGNSTTRFTGTAAGFGAATVNASSGYVGFAVGRVGSATVRMDGANVFFVDSGNAGGTFQLVEGRNANFYADTNTVALSTLGGTGDNLYLQNSGTLRLLSGSPTLTGTFRANAGTLAVDGATVSTNAVDIFNGTIRSDSGSITAADGIYMGTATLTVAGGTVNAVRIRTSEGGGTVSTLNQSGGTVNITGSVIENGTDNSFMLNHWSGTSTYNLSGGTLNVLNTNVNIGWDGNAYINQSGGTANLRGVNFASGRNNAGGYTLSGGRLNLGVGGITAASAKTLTAGDATLGAMANWTSASAITLNGDTGTVIHTTDSVDGVTGRTVTVSGALSGTGKLITSGAGTVVLSGANTNSGAIQVDAGTLRVTGTLRGGAALSVAQGATLELNGTNPFTIGHANAVSATQTLSSVGGTIVLGSAFEGRLGNINLDGATLTSNRGLGSWDVYLADTTAGAALVTVGGSSASLMNGTGGIHLGTNVRFDVANVTADDTADLLVSMRLDNGGLIGTTGSLTKSGLGTLVLDNALNSFTGGVTVEAGVLRVVSAGSLSTGDITVTGGLLDLGNFAFSGNITLAGGILVNSQGWTGQGTVTTPFTVDPGFLASLDTGSTFSVLPGMTADLTGITAAIDFRGGSLAGLGSYAGPLTVSSGTLDLTTATPLGTLALAGTGVIDFGGRELVMDIAYSGGSLLNADNYTGEITVTSASTTLVAGSLGGGIVIAGDGRQLVFGANFANNVRLVGGSVLNLENFGGTLFVGPGSSVNLGSIEGGTETVTLASIVLEQGGTLSGEGTLSALTLDTGGVLNVGNSPGVITIVNDLALNGGSQRFEVRQATDVLTGLPSQAGVDYDLVEVGGVLDLSGLSASNTFLLELISLQINDSPGSLADFDPNLSYSFTLYDFATYELGATPLGSLNSLFTINTDGFVDMNGGQVDSSMFSVVLDSSNSSLVLQYGVVPEPSTYGLMLGGLALALSAWRRRRQPPAAKA